MVKTIRTFFLSLTILAFLLFSTVGTMTAYADDGTGTEAKNIRLRDQGALRQSEVADGRVIPFPWVSNPYLNGFDGP